MQDMALARREGSDASLFGPEGATAMAAALAGRLPAGGGHAAAAGPARSLSSKLWKPAQGLMHRIGRRRSSNSGGYISASRQHTATLGALDDAEAEGDPVLAAAQQQHSMVPASARSFGSSPTVTPGDSLPNSRVSA
jgi:hypothetical protein